MRQWPPQRVSRRRNASRRRGWREKRGHTHAHARRPRSLTCDTICEAYSATQCAVHNQQLFVAHFMIHILQHSATYYGTQILWSTCNGIQHILQQTQILQHTYPTSHFLQDILNYTFILQSTSRNTCILKYIRFATLALNVQHILQHTHPTTYTLCNVLALPASHILQRLLQHTHPTTFALQRSHLSCNTHPSHGWRPEIAGDSRR